LKTIVTKISTLCTKNENKIHCYHYVSEHSLIYGYIERGRPTGDAAGFISKCI